MVDLVAIQAAGASLKTAADIAGGLLKLKISSEVQFKIIELQREIIAAQNSAMSAQTDQFALVQQVRDLEQEIVQLKNWDAEKQRYVLKAVDHGTFAYVPKPEVQGAEPPHWLCTNCFEKGHKSILQFRGQLKNPGGGRGDHCEWICNSCKAKVLAYYNKSPSRA